MILYVEFSNSEIILQPVLMSQCLEDDLFFTTIVLFYLTFTDINLRLRTDFMHFCHSNEFSPFVRFLSHDECM